MGTRADFYTMGNGTLIWLGSVGYDGMPDSIDFGVLYSKTKTEFKKELKEFFEKNKEYVTMPKDGWPWPWENSETTDYAYIFDKNKVYVSKFGSNLKDALEYSKIQSELRTLNHTARIMEKNDLVAKAMRTEIAKREEQLEKPSKRKVSFPDMTSIQKISYGKNSGLIVIGAK